MKKQPDKQTKSKNLPLMIAAAAVLCVAVLVVLLEPGQGGRISSGNNVQVQTGSIGEGEALVIPVSEITSTAQFYQVNVDGTVMEVIAVRDSDGNVRTAFNTCQVCYNSGRGYYIQEGDQLVCQNCGNRFTVDQVEIQTGGCNPWPIFGENKTVTEDTIEISYDFLTASKAIFENWSR